MEKSIILKVTEELDAQVSSPGVMRALVATTFKGFKSEQLVRQACLEAMMRGYKFQDLLDKKVYAIPYGNGYTLVQSISDVRAKAMKSGQVGKSAPIFEDDENGKIKTCTITIKRKVDEYVGNYTAMVYFDEYNTGKNNWAKMPRTMIAKVAEMHALRMAFPEELSQVYVEEEFKGEVIEEGLEQLVKDEIDAINTFKGLKEYFTKNKGRGKQFNAYIEKRMKEITEKQNENSSNTTGDTGVVGVKEDENDSESRSSDSK